MNNELRIAAMVFDKNIYFKILKDSDLVIPLLENDKLNDMGIDLFEKNCTKNADEHFRSFISDIINQYKNKKHCTLFDIIDMSVEIEKKTDINIANNLFI